MGFNWGQKDTAGAHGGEYDQAKAEGAAADARWSTHKQLFGEGQTQAIASGGRALGPDGKPVQVKQYSDWPSLTSAINTPGLEAKMIMPSKPGETGQLSFTADEQRAASSRGDKAPAVNSVDEALKWMSGRLGNAVRQKSEYTEANKQVPFYPQGVSSTEHAKGAAADKTMGTITDARQVSDFYGEAMDIVGWDPSQSLEYNRGKLEGVMKMRGLSGGGTSTVQPPSPTAGAEDKSPTGWAKRRLASDPAAFQRAMDAYPMVVSNPVGPARDKAQKAWTEWVKGGAKGSFGG
jgi:hypothetical protein